MKITSERVIRYLNNLAIEAEDEQLVVSAGDDVELTTYCHILDNLIQEVAQGLKAGCVCADCLHIINKIADLLPALR